MKKTIFMHHRSILLAAVMMILGLALLPSLSEAQQVRLRYAHVGSEGDIQFWYGEQAAKKIPEVTGDASRLPSFRTRNSAASRR